MTKHNNKSKHKKYGKHKVNPLTVMKSRPKVNFHFDGQILNGTGFSVPLVTVSNFAAGIYFVDCSNVQSGGSGLFYQSISKDFSSITDYYNEYFYHSVHCEWMPYISPGIADGGSQIYICYIDNAEEMAGLPGSSIATNFNIAKSSRNMKFFNAWERFSYNVPLSRRRKTFDVNTNTAYTVDVVDRSVQGAVITGLSSSSAAVSLGQWRFTYILELRNLNTNIAT